MTHWAFAIIAAFALGSIPFSLLVGLARGVDIRTVGSKNVGATNLGRTLGGRFFAIGFTLDTLKGFAPVLIAGLVAGVLGEVELAPADAWLWLATAAAAVLGHTFSPWVGFKGGKGVATALGAALGLFPALTVPGAGALVVFLVVLGLWRYVSAASVTAAVALPAFTYLFFGQVRELVQARAVREAEQAGPLTIEAVRIIRDRASAGVDPIPFLVVTIALGLLVIVRHKANLARLADGTEPKVGTKAPPSAPAQAETTPPA
ncbi:MAG: glycerol-3-phosphate acyltransferase [Planctomycetota bacterium]